MYRLLLAMSLLVLAEACAPGVLGQEYQGPPLPLPAHGVAQPTHGFAAPSEPPSSETTIDKARSTVSFWALSGPMSSELQHEFRERHPAAPPDTATSYLAYSASTRAGKAISVQLRYTGSPATLAIGTNGGVGLWNLQPQIQQFQSTGGQVAISAAINQRVRIDFSNLSFYDGEGTTMDVQSGFVEGQVTRLCYKIETKVLGGPNGPVDAQGNPPTIVDHVLDETWSSPFCAALAH